MSFAASLKLKVSTGDLENAYFSGEELARTLLLRQPRGGILGLNLGDRLLARVPIYGVSDAGRGFLEEVEDSPHRSRAS